MDFCKATYFLYYADGFVGFRIVKEITYQGFALFYLKTHTNFRNLLGTPLKEHVEVFSKPPATGDIDQ
jgi:hypothetical protein